MPLHPHEPDRGSEDFLAIRPQFARRGELQAVPRFRLAREGMDPDTAYQVVHDELLLDGSARLNLATFVTTWMEPQARSLIAETLDKNMIDKDEYPQTAELERRCVSILADLWHAEAAGSGSGPRRSARARRRCWAVSRSSGAGGSGGRRAGSRSIARTS